jgi:hypothetical protein
VEGEDNIAMEYPEHLENTLAFGRLEAIGGVVSEEKEQEKIISNWTKFIDHQYQKGLIPLFITGCGVSIDAEVPAISGIINKLKEIYDQSNVKCDDADKLFATIEELTKNRKIDRSIVARLLNIFQENKELKQAWKKLNEWLLGEILKAKRSDFHKGLADLYEKFNAVCLTLNFDGLLIREFIEHRAEGNGNKRAFSLPTKKECEKFFVRNMPDDKEAKEFLEIQIRGDILYVVCTSKEYCPQKGEKRPLWAYLASYKGSDAQGNDKLKPEFLLRCSSCGETGTSFLSFPGSYDKEKDMQDMLEIVWKYLAFRVGSVIVVGMSGEWDPLIIAFLGDLLSEREIIPLLVVDINENTYVIRELVKPKNHYAVALTIKADDFMKKLVQKINDPQNHLSEPNLSYEIDPFDDKYWKGKVESDGNLEELINFKHTSLENKLKELLSNESLDKFAQLGLKSHWLGIKPDNKEGRYHKRYYHSLGVSKVASYLYQKAFENSKIEQNEKEKQFLKIAALLHDIGHLPFSHLIEDVFNELNWKPAGYKGFYSHVFQTNEKIEELFKKPELINELKTLGYDVRDLINLVNGCFGVSYLDAIINSPLDADKIDYIFRDTDLTGRKIHLSPVQFLKDIGAGLQITPEGFLAFSGLSARALTELLEARMYLYNSLYLQHGIVVLEGIVKLIIKTFFVSVLRLDSPDLLQRINPSAKGYPDLGDYKISYCINKLKDLLSKAETSNNSVNFELKIVELMFNEIKNMKAIFNDTFLEALERGFNAVKATEDENKLKALERMISYRRFKGKEIKDKLDEIRRDIQLKIPGAIIIEIIKSPKILSTADARKIKERSDGTKTFVECILVPDGNYETWTLTSKATRGLHDASLKNESEENITVCLYPLSEDTDDSYFRHAVNLFDKLSRKKGIYSLEELNGKK